MVNHKIVMYKQDYNKYRKAFQERGIVVFPVKGTTVQDYSLGKAPYNNPKFDRLHSFYSFKERPFTEDEMDYYFSLEKGDIGLAVLFGEVKGREGLYLVGLDVDRMDEGTVEDFTTYCIDNGMAVAHSASKGVHVYGYSKVPFPDTAVTVTLGKFKVSGDLWGNGGKYFVCPPTRISGGEYTQTDSFISALFIEDFQEYPQHFIKAFEDGSNTTAEKIRGINRVPVSSIDVEGFIKAYSATKITKGELGRHHSLIAIAKAIFKRVYNDMSADEAITLVEKVLIGLRDNGTIEDGSDKTDRELADISRYCYGYRKKWEDEIKSPEFKKIAREYRISGKFPNGLDDFKKKFITSKVQRSFDVDRHKDMVEKVKVLKRKLVGLEGKAFNDVKNEIKFLREYIYNEAYYRILNDKANLKYDVEGDRFYDYNAKKGIYYEIEPKMFESEIMAYLTSYGLDGHATRAKAQDVRARMLRYAHRFKVTRNDSLTCVGNGILNINTGELLAFTPDFITLSNISTNYNPDAVIEGSRFERFIYEINSGDKEQVRLLQQYTGYILTPSTKYQKCLMMIGEGSNGKGVFTGSVIKSLVGEVAYSSMDIDDLNKNFSVSTLVNKRVNVCDETSNKYIDSHVLKSLISGEDQTCDVKNKKQIQFKPEVKIIVTVNDLPSISDTSYGLYRRFIIMDMKESFTVEKGNLDPNLSKELAKEKEIILKWALLGYQDLEKEEKFNIQQLNIDSLGEYKLDNDAVARFIVNAFQPMESSSYTLIEVYREYKIYCHSIGKTAKNIGNFSKDLKRNERCGELFEYEKRMNGHDVAKVSGIKINREFLSDFDVF